MIGRKARLRCSKTLEGDHSQFGVFAANPFVASAFTAEIVFFYITATPILPEDGDQITLTVNVTGQGTVFESPDQTSYLCGDTMLLNATPDEGWIFLIL